MRFYSKIARNNLEHTHFILLLRFPCSMLKNTTFLLDLFEQNTRKTTTASGQGSTKAGLPNHRPSHTRRARCRPSATPSSRSSSSSTSVSSSSSCSSASAGKSRNHLRQIRPTRTFPWSPPCWRRWRNRFKCLISLFMKKYSQTWSKGHLQIIITCLQRPLFCCRVFMIIT